MVFSLAIAFAQPQLELADLTFYGDEPVTASIGPRLPNGETLGKGRLHVVAQLVTQRLHEPVMVEVCLVSTDFRRCESIGAMEESGALDISTDMFAGRHPDGAMRLWEAPPNQVRARLTNRQGKALQFPAAIPVRVWASWVPEGVAYEVPGAALAPACVDQVHSNAPCLSMTQNLCMFHRRAVDHPRNPGSHLTACPTDPSRLAALLPKKACDRARTCRGVSDEGCCVDCTSFMATRLPEDCATAIEAADDCFDVRTTLELPVCAPP